MTFRTYLYPRPKRKESDHVEDLTDDEREADLQAAKAHRELAEEPLLRNNPDYGSQKAWHLSEAQRLEGLHGIVRGNLTCGWRNNDDRS